MNNSLILNSTQTFKPARLVDQSEIQSPSMQKETTLLPEVIEEEIITPPKSMKPEKKQSTSVNYF